MNYHKRIVFDYDDTIAIPTNRDWEHAEPNVPLILKMNSLYDMGWRIEIFTARGSISCKTREEAKDKYEEGIVKWLATHNVKYHELSFEKPLAAYYVDDKALTPKAFTELNIHNLTGGLSGDDIYTDGHEVHKTSANAHSVAKWFDYARTVVSVPDVYRVVGDTMSMEYIMFDPHFFGERMYRALGMIQEAIAQMKTLPPLNTLTFDSYVDRIADHAKLCDDPELDKVVDALRNMHLQPTFAHGDFGITNLLFSNDTTKVTLIDPLPDVFGCGTLDAAKFVASLYVNHYDEQIIWLTTDALKVFNYPTVDDVGFITLIKAELIRIIKYHDNPEFIKECIANVS